MTEAFEYSGRSGPYGHTMHAKQTHSVSSRKSCAIHIPLHTVANSVISFKLFPFLSLFILLKQESFVLEYGSNAFQGHLARDYNSEDTNSKGLETPLLSLAGKLPNKTSLLSCKSRTEGQISALLTAQDWV